MNHLSWASLLGGKVYIALVHDLVTDLTPCLDGDNAFLFFTNL